MEIKDILLAFQKSKHLSGRAFAASIGIDAAQYSKYLKGHNVPLVSTLEKIKAVYPDFQYSGNIMVNEEPMIYEVRTKTLPVIDLFGQPAKGQQQYDINKAKVVDYFAIPIFREAIAYIRIKDDSMNGLLNSGDYAAIGKADINGVVFGEKYLIIFKAVTREPVIRFVRKGSKEDRWLLKPVNSNYDDFEILVSDIREIYIIKGGVLAR